MRDRPSLSGKDHSHAPLLYSREKGMLNFRSGVSPDWAMGTIRLSVGRMTTEEEVEEAAKGRI
jgi:hypothetical protein